MSRSGRLVVDTNVALWSAAGGGELDVLGADELIAPPLLWSEARSALHEASCRGQLDPGHARQALHALDALPITAEEPAGLGERTWQVADELGWAKTYDAEFVALALLRDARVVTLDGRLRRGADRLGVVVGPTEL